MTLLSSTVFTTSCNVSDKLSTFYFCLDVFFSISSRGVVNFDHTLNLETIVWSHAIVGAASIIELVHCVRASRGSFRTFHVHVPKPKCTIVCL